ncbi:MAG: TVP38/TMEM64 family protein [Thermoflexus sp.]
MAMKEGKSKRLSPSLILRASLLFGLFAGALLMLPYLWPLVTERERIEAWLAANRTAGALALVLLNALQVIVAPLPGALLGWISGYWFGPWWGSLLTWVGVSLGNGLTMVLARSLGRPLWVAFLPSERLKRADDLLRRHGLSVVLIVFLLPFTPDDLLSWAIGLSPLPLIPALAVSTLARLVHVLIANTLGAYLRSGDLLWVGIAVLLSTGALLAAWWIVRATHISPAEIYGEDY